MAEERLVESIKLLPWPNSCFNWYEIVPKWFGSTSYRYEILVRNSYVYAYTEANVGEDHVTETLRNRLKCVCNFINKVSLSEVSSSERPYLTDDKVVEALNLFKGLTLVKNNIYDPTKYMDFKFLHNPVTIQRIVNSDYFCYQRLNNLVICRKIIAILFAYVRKNRYLCICETAG